MALIKLGALAQDVRGSLNGTTFSRNRGGAYARTKVSPVQPVSAYSANSRQAFKIVAQTWAALLSDSDRAAWIAFAALHPFINVFGDSITLSGIAFYSAAMKRLQQIGFPIFDTPPVTWDVDPPGNIAPVLAADGGGNVSLLINPDNAPGSGDVTAYLFATPVLAPGVTPQKSDFRLVNDFLGNVRDETYDWGPLFKTRFAGAVPPDGSKIAVKYGYLDTLTGALSVPSSAVIFSTGVPGPLINLSNVEGQDAGGGNFTRVYYTEEPHGLLVGQTLTGVATGSGDFDGAHVVTAVTSPTIVQAGTHAGAAFPPATSTGTIQRTA